MMRRFALLFLALAIFAAAPPAMAEAPLGGSSGDTIRSVLPAPRDLEAAGAILLRLERLGRHGGIQLACSQGCLRRCAAVYRRCQARSRDWRRCSAVRRNCIRSCGC